MKAKILPNIGNFSEANVANATEQTAQNDFIQSLQALDPFQTVELKQSSSIFSKKMTA